MRVTVANFKGGVGKTTTAIHLAAFLAEQGETLLLDGDPNRSASAWARKGQLPFTVADINQAKDMVRLSYVPLQNWWGIEYHLESPLLSGIEADYKVYLPVGRRSPNVHWITP